MATFIISVSKDQRGAIVTTPGPVFVRAGDIVQWGSVQGNLSVSFPEGSPFLEPGPFQAERGALTKEVKIKRGLRVNQFFPCKAFIDAPPFQSALGVIIRDNIDD